MPAQAVCLQGGANGPRMLICRNGSVASGCQQKCAALTQPIYTSRQAMVAKDVWRSGGRNMFPEVSLKLHPCCCERSQPQRHLPLCVCQSGLLYRHTGTDVSLYRVSLDAESVPMTSGVLSQVTVACYVGFCPVSLGIVDIGRRNYYSVTEIAVYCLIRWPIRRERRQRGKCMGGGGRLAKFPGCLPQAAALPRYPWQPRRRFKPPWRQRP